MHKMECVRPLIIFYSFVFTCHLGSHSHRSVSHTIGLLFRVYFELSQKKVEAAAVAAVLL